MDIIKSTAVYETWLRAQLQDEFVEKDWKRKYEKMSSGPFPFLRATYWRWAETIDAICPELRNAPSVLAVGDIHLENYGTWRDADGRLVWGVNDFDEATEMPYAIDLVRLATSAALADADRSRRLQYICGAVLEGYRRGLEKPRPSVLDRRRAWLRDIVEVEKTARNKFWDDLAGLKPPDAPPRPRYVAALHAALPEHLEDVEIAPRQAGAGSLGRPRWVAIAKWRGAPLVREAKVLVPSAWNLVEGRGGFSIRWNEVATGRYRAPDPWFRLTDNIIVRRLSPNNRKIEAKSAADRKHLLGKRLLQAMGRDLASIHLGSVDLRKRIRRDLGRRDAAWLVAATKAARKKVLADYADWIAVHPKVQKSKKKTMRSRRKARKAK